MDNTQNTLLVVPRPKLKKKDTFRISAKKLYLTYSQVHQDLDSNTVLTALKKNHSLPFFDYIIAKEYHQDGGIHFHALLLFNKKVNITCPQTLDIQYQDHKYHGNYQAARSLERVVDYICKHGDYITSLPNIVDGQFVSMKEMLVRDVQQLGTLQALIKHAEGQTNKALANLSLLHTHSYFQKLEQLKASVQADTIETPFKLENFYLSQQLTHWINNPNKTLVLVGPSGVGKTAFCKAFIKDKNLKTLIVNHKEDFTRLNSEHDAVLMDDASFTDLKPTDLLALLDNKASKTLRVLYKTVFKKENLIQMLAMNQPEFEHLFKTLATDRFARRTHFEHLKEPFINNLTVNIQINNNNTNNINNLSFSDAKAQEHRETQQTIQAMQKCYDEITQ